ncbi:TPA: CXXX repeat peptide modification system protein [Enterococcus faecium]|nr:CXXX repeat peptide modification system protein [Enterococcus faecium]HEQ3792058.1 CXXX repeat peptide modification system protein [Streptococcus pyogenes]HAQ5162150.1 CXXX repeat peptide modification system protein [Enterococcus faecium]HAQ5173911.1 CXXX repeat peptide modification system protein [Enterococcus faecium]HAQ5180213.1 CXXX repeat peptide modification system protein [Enterococcus faecium]
MKEVGTLTHEESRNLEELLEKKIALENLLKILSESQEIYKKVVRDYKNIAEEYEKWWRDTSNKYIWESTDNSFRSIDFKSRKVYLVDE